MELFVGGSVWLLAEVCIIPKNYHVLSPIILCTCNFINSIKLNPVALRRMESGYKWEADHYGYYRYIYRQRYV